MVYDDILNNLSALSEEQLGTLLSTVFFAENLKRLGTKVASGGKDDGYTKSSNQRRR